MHSLPAAQLWPFAFWFRQVPPLSQYWPAAQAVLLGHGPQAVALTQ